MFFTDTAFFVFLPIVVAVYWLLPFRWQNIWLLLTSYLFYGFVVPWTVFLLFGVTLVCWASALLFQRFPDRKKLILSACCIAALLPLARLKYGAFFAENVKFLFPPLDVDLKCFLPAGISFFTFQGLAYVADVYEGRVPAEKSLTRFALFKAFFPQLVAGPIERAENLLKQINSPRRFSLERFLGGVDLLLLGYLKKVVVADNVAVYVNMIFDLKQPSALLVFAGAVGFSIQILADFSAYTDIARASARFMGFELMENFRHPYLARNPSEFWRRWHISLSNLIRDYLYFPLGGSRVSLLRWLFNMFTVWFLCGLWHGAAWNFVAWGLYWGLLLVLYRFIRIFPDRPVFDPLRIAVMYFWGCCGWLLFRVSDFSLFATYFSRQAFHSITAQLPSTLAVLAIFAVYASPLVLIMMLERAVSAAPRKQVYLPALRTLGYAAASLVLVIFATETGSDFYYFQF